MLVVLPFHAGDKSLAVTLADWISDLGGASGHECMVMHPPNTDSEGVLEPLQRAFKKVFLYKIPATATGWPAGANEMFRRAARQIQATSPQPWLFLEPDAIPLIPTWLDQIEAAYKTCGKACMGARVKLPNILEHMSGVAVYPGNTPRIAPLLVTANKVAFDVNGARQVLPQMAETALIQHEWKPATFATAEDLKRISPMAVIYHQSKDGSAIARLREKRGVTPEFPLPLADGEFPTPPGYVKNPAYALASHEMVAPGVFVGISPQERLAALREDVAPAVRALCDGLRFIAQMGEKEAELVGAEFARTVIRA